MKIRRKSYISKYKRNPFFQIKNNPKKEKEEK